MFFFYNLLFYLLHPFLLIFLKFRVMIGKEDKERYIEKIGYTKCVSPGVIWFHVASLGEIKSIHPIIKFYQNKNLEILITSVTLSSYEYFLNSNKIRFDASNWYCFIFIIGLYFMDILVLNDY